MFENVRFRENELDKLRKMLTDAGIPFESVQEEFTDSSYLWLLRHRYNYPAAKWSKNQVIYGRYNDDEYDDYLGTRWKLDGVCQLGTYGAEKGLIETYGPLGVDDDYEPRVLTAEEVFAIIKEDWSKQNAET